VVGSCFQRCPSSVAALLPSSTFVRSVATQGICYEFTDVPVQNSRPRPFPLTKLSAAAETAEVSRLSKVGAIEKAPPHDGHKALDPSAADAYELQPPPPRPYLGAAWFQ
jgi:hypothetical protein